MNFSADLDIGDTSFSLIDRIDLLGVDGLVPRLADSRENQSRRTKFQPAMMI